MITIEPRSTEEAYKTPGVRMLISHAIDKAAIVNILTTFRKECGEKSFKDVLERAGVYVPEPAPVKPVEGPFYVQVGDTEFFGHGPLGKHEVAFEQINEAIAKASYLAKTHDKVTVVIAKHFKITPGLLRVDHLTKA